MGWVCIVVVWEGRREGSLCADAYVCISFSLTLKGYCNWRRIICYPPWTHASEFGMYFSFVSNPKSEKLVCLRAACQILSCEPSQTALSCAIEAARAVGQALKGLSKRKKRRHGTSSADAASGDQDTEDIDATARAAIASVADPGHRHALLNCLP